MKDCPALVYWGWQNAIFTGCVNLIGLTVQNSLQMIDSLKEWGFVVSFRVFCHKIASSECEREKARRREEQQQPQYVCQQHVQDWRLRLCRRWARQVPYYLAQPVKHYFLQSFWCPAHWRTTEVCLWKCWNGGELPNINAFSITCVNLIFKGDDLLKKNWLAQRSSPRGWRESQR